MDSQLDTAPCGFLSFTDNGAIVAANATLYRWLGHEAGTLAGKHIETLLPVASRIFYQTHFFPLLKIAGAAEEVYLTLRTTTDETLPVLMNAVRRERDGAIMNDCAVMVMRQRDRYEDEILHARRASEEVRMWLSTTLQSIGDAVIATDTQGLVVFLNPSAEELTGWPEREAVGKTLDSVFVIVNEQTHQPVESPVTKVLREKRVVGLANHTLLIARDGASRPIDDSGAPIRDATGEIRGVVLVFRDCSERRQVERELSENQTRIQALNHHLQRAMTETHHRVKNNLQVISALIDLQLIDGRESIPRSELARLSQHISSLAVIHDLLTHQARQGDESETISVRATLDRLFPLLQGISPGRRLHFEVEDTRLSIRQATSLAVLANELVSNATKHARGDIGIVFHTEGHVGTFEVWDEGDGFPEGFNPLTSANTGVELVETVSRYDLQGEVVYQNRPSGGRVMVTFPVS